MRSRAAAVSVLLVFLAGALAGCAGKEPEPRPVAPANVGYDPTTSTVTAVAVHNVTLPSWDGVTHLAVRAYAPTLSVGRPPVVLFLHGWGNNKESYEGVQSYPAATPLPDGSPNHLLDFARQGFLAVAYDARGFGESEGRASVAGPAERADFSAVLDWALATFPTNGLVGVVGQSYGGGQAFAAWALDPRVTTAVPMYGWVDLYQALVTGNVPKLEWAQALYGYGLAGALGDYDPMVHEWYTNLYTRQDLPTLRAQMADRSTLPLLPAVRKPLLVCQGMEESLFPQVDLAALGAGGFTRSYVFRGGHGDAAPGCWSRALDWFRFFLQGYDTHVDAWPALETVDLAGDATAAYATFPAATPALYNLRSGELYVGPASQARFTIEQRVAANPIGEPGGVWDQAGLPNQPLPSQLRMDPAGVVFTTPMLPAGTLVGAPVLKLRLAADTNPPFQVAGTLRILHKDGTSTVATRTAAAALEDADVADGNLTLRFHWVKADLQAEDRVELKLAANDPDWWMPLLADYAATFDGRSTLELPIQ